MIRNISTFVAIAVAFVAFALMPSTAVAQSYTGNFPVTLTQLQLGGNATYCMTLTDNGSLGRPHSGPAFLAGVDPGGPLFGTFQLIGRLLTATFQQPGGNGQNAGLVFVAPASNGNIGKGVFDLVLGGEELNSAVATFAAKGGC